MITANALICGKKIQLVVIKIMSLGYITYDSDRTRGSNHGDLAWSTMLSIINEPLGQEFGGGGFAMEF
ncbi:hypothetical protein [Symbiopectobacterium sp. RP]|uniref:hypothetical protein n=1 Tax=Symbiopectobacterium sp. RP TaxID=3248553 RepID=UPI003D2653F3